MIINMIFEQLFDNKSSTYTYILSSGEGREALIIDPVIEHTEEYIKLLEKTYENYEKQLFFNNNRFYGFDGLLYRWLQWD